MVYGFVCGGLGHRHFFACLLFVLLLLACFCLVLFGVSLCLFTLVDLFTCEVFVISCVCVDLVVML